MSKDEKRLVVMLSMTDMDIDQITAVMCMLNETKNGISLLVHYLDETNDHNPQTIMKKATEIYKDQGL